MFTGKKVFVSGGSGVIGTALVEKLYKMNADIFVGDLKPCPEEWHGLIKYRQGDLNYIRKEEIDHFAPEYFFHLAATFERSSESYEHWDQNYDHNIKLSHYLMDILKDTDYLKRFIFASSYLIYDSKLYMFEKPPRKATRLKETDIVYPRNICGAAKFLHELELRFLEEFKSESFSSVSARIFRVYGRNSRDVISRWIRSLLVNEKLTIYRTEGMFDYIFADEVAEGLIRLAISDVTGVLNLGNDNARSVEEVLFILKKHFPDMKTEKIDINMPYEGSQANMDKFVSFIHWKPKTQLEDAIPEMINYEKNKKNITTDYKEKNVMVTSISKKVPLLKNVKEAISKVGQGKVWGADIDDKCIGRHFVSNFWKMPAIKDLKIYDLISFCKLNNIFFIIPSRDGELLYFAKHKQELLNNDITVMVSDEESVNMCLDKLAFYKKGKSLGFPVILTSLAYNNIESNIFVVKERYGAGSYNVGLKLSKDQAISHSLKLTAPVFQPYIEGKEYSVDLFLNKMGKTKGVIVRERALVVDGESQVTITAKNMEIERLCSDMAEAMGLYGHINMQLILDNQNKPNIIECNCRFGGASTISIKAGLDSFYWFFLESLDNDISDYPFIRSNKNIKQIRYAEDYLILE